MQLTEKSITRFLTGLGLTPEEAKVYLLLNHHGPLTTLELSRKSGVNRTQVYRLIESMKEKGVIEEVVEEHHTKAKSIEPEQLEYILKEKEQDITFLRKQFPNIQTLLKQETDIHIPGTKVMYYRGRRGLQQMGWNVLSARGELVGYTFRAYHEAVGKRFAYDLMSEVVERKITFRELFSDPYLDSTQGTGQEGIYQSIKGFSTYMHSRYIPKNILPITSQMDIYNNVVAIYNWYKDEVFGVEIYNATVASMQKHIFDHLWSHAIPEEKIFGKRT